MDSTIIKQRKDKTFKSTKDITQNIKFKKIKIKLSQTN